MRHGLVVHRIHDGIMLGLVWASMTGAAIAAAAPAITLSLRLPITGTIDTQVEGAIIRQLDHLRSSPGERGILVLRFDPADGSDAETSDFGRALELARFLTSPRLAGVRTVAWLPEGASGHAVLVALACDTIAMPADAVLGPANIGEPLIDEAMRAAYREIAARRRTIPPVVAVGMLDPAARVLRVSTDAGEEFVAPEDLGAVKDRAAVLATTDLAPTPLAFDGRQAREFGFVGILAGQPAELARGLGLAEEMLAGDPSLEGGWRAAQVTLSGGTSADLIGRLKQRIERSVDSGANFICLRIDSAGGSPEQSLVLANWLAGLDPTRVRTVAWVPREARGDAALVALACDELVMAPAAVLGGEGAAVIDQRQAEAIAAAWRGGVARIRDRPWSLPLATVLPGLALERAEQQGTGRIEYFTAEELAERDDRVEWRKGPELGPSPLRLDGRRAESLGLAAHVADDFAGLRQAYGLEGDLTVAEPGWADQLLDALASPGLAWILLLVGLAGLYIEVKTPGIGLGGFVSMVAFIVYFWSQYLHGTSGWLEVMLFLAGIVCVLAEIFVLPGFGVLGLGGGLLVIASLVLASQSFVVPMNDYQIERMQWSLVGVLGAVAGVAVLAVAVQRWLPATPGLRSVLLAPPAEAEFDEAAPAEELVGAEGVTTTRLAPAGRARIDGEVLEVASAGPLIEPGTAVRVVEVRGGRVIVVPTERA